ncbi:hydrophobe/amphiphile efflux-1 family RND transporter [Rhodothalassium salexigens]|uniref:efflux RND transporter permease subunit n=1 Tax=Rhodothalassium salexigens TaxID=1086 RepID=UPI0019132FAF|nr:multidrug efflux RND transporter permease subunit [Rhodothalassium salexigens]MBK5921888.1 hydrophobe/amphiphile efflux-1 family RND transporter [Rhodothalassium salexigens]
MKLTHIFVERPIFATVVSLVVTILGGISLLNLPVAQYPDVVPPTIQVQATYPGADAETVAKTVATPIEQEVNGVEGMLYMSSQSTASGNMTLTITFELGTDLDEAQVLVQNRVAVAEPRLPEEVRRLGVTTRKNSPDLMMVIHLLSPDESLDQLYIANYAALQLRDPLARIDGVGDLRIYGGSEYSMRVWLDPDRLASVGLTGLDVVNTLRRQNVQVASGTLNDEPLPQPESAFELSVRTKGRLVEPEEFADIVIKSDARGRVVRLGDVGRVELAAEDYVTRSYMDGKPAVALPIFQRPGTNALATADRIKAQMAEFSETFPKGLEYRIIYNPTDFVQQSVDAVVKTIFEAALLVVLVIVLFLQRWNAAIIPILAIPVSLIGTFAMMQAFGFSLNNLTLFGLVLAIGIVVDDAIVVVENVERNLREGLAPKEAAHKTMDEVGTALVAMSLALVAVFVPTAFIEGISGQFYRQFALTISVATLLSLLVSLTLSPALCALLLKGRSHAETSNGPIGRLFGAFNRGFDRTAQRYSRGVAWVLRRGAIMGVLYLALLGGTAFEYSRVPGGFIPQQDQGYFIVSAQLPPGATMERTDTVVQEITGRAMDVDGVGHVVGFAGLNGATFTLASNAATIFLPLEPFSVRLDTGRDFQAILTDLRRAVAGITDAQVVVIPPPPVRGIGNAGGFKMMVQDRRGRGLDTLSQSVQQLANAANQAPETTQVFSFFETRTPQLYVDVDRTRAEILQVPVSDVFSTLEVYVGSAFVNDFNFLGRTYRVTAQADWPHRLDPDDLARLRTRNADGEMVPLGSVATFRDVTGPSRVPRYNLYPSAALQGDTVAGFSSGEALARMEQLADEVLPPGIGYEWTDLAFQQKQTGNTAALAFVLAVVFAFLVLSAQYESWLLPLAVIMIVPMSIFGAMVGIDLLGLDNNLLTQIGLVVLVGLASKNAILIVEFARQRELEGADRFQAAVDAARVRLRPILMTAGAFILGVLPLVVAEGAGAEMRRAIGTAVFSGMLGVTLFGLVFTPLFYVACRKLARDSGPQPAAASGDGRAADASGADA